MAATNKWKPVGFFILASALLIPPYQNCAVDLKPTTPGAADISSAICEPTTAALNSIVTPYTTILQQKTALAGGPRLGCAACHGESALNSAKAVYLVFEGDPSTNPEILKKNHCSIATVNGKIINHVLGESHSGGKYTTSEIQALITYVNTYF